MSSFKEMRPLLRELVAATLHISSTTRLVLKGNVSDYLKRHAATAFSFSRWCLTPLFPPYVLIGDFSTPLCETLATCHLLHFLNMLP